MGGEVTAGGGLIGPLCGAIKLSPTGRYRYLCTLSAFHPVEDDRSHRWGDAERTVPDLADSTAVAAWLDDD